MKIKIRGIIVPNDDKWVYDLFEMEAISPKDIEDQLALANGEELEVEINSPGGDVYSGSEIYTALKEYAGDVTVKIMGLAASAAGVIAMAGKTVMISPPAQIMIHNVSAYGAYGDYRVLEHEAAVLKNYNVSIANAYQLKTGLDQKELLGMMNKETWLNAQQAIEKGFADKIMFDEGMRLTASTGNGMVPREIMNKIRTLLKKDQLGESPSNQLVDPPPIEAPRQAPVNLIDVYQKQILINRRKANV